MDNLERSDVPVEGGGQTPEESDEALARQQLAFIERDYDEFERRFPKVDIAALDGDATFRRFCGSRYGKESLADLYEDYLAVAGAIREAVLARAGSRSARATGSGGGHADKSLTAAEQRELEEWNRANPSMKMTAREFLSR